MKVEQCIVEKQGVVMAITDRVRLECELVETISETRVKVRLLEAGAGLEIGAEIIVPASKISDTP